MLGGGEQCRRVGVAEDGAQGHDERAAQPGIVVVPEPEEQLGQRRGCARADQCLGGGLLDVHVRTVKTCGDRGARPVGTCVTKGEQGLPDSLDVLSGGQRDQGRRQRLCVLAGGVAGEQGDDVFAYVPVAVAQQPVHPGAGARPGGLEQQFEQNRLLAVGQPWPVQEIQCRGRDECVVGLSRVCRLQQADGPDRAPLVEPTAQGVHGVQDLLRHHGLTARLPVFPLPHRRLLGHDAQ